jgi:hypothetical protein
MKIPGVFFVGGFCASILHWVEFISKTGKDRVTSERFPFESFLKFLCVPVVFAQFLRTHLTS